MNCNKSLIYVFLVLFFTTLTYKLNSQVIPKRNYNVVFLTQKDYISNYTAATSFKDIVDNLPHGKKIGVGSLIITRCDSGKFKIFDANNYNMQDAIFTEELNANNCYGDFNLWMKCALSNYSASRDYIFALNTSNTTSKVDTVAIGSERIKVYYNSSDLIKDIQSTVKIIRKEKQNKSIIILHFQDNQIDPCLILNEKIKNNNQNLKVEFINYNSGVKVKAIPYEFYKKYYVFKCSNLTEFDYFEFILMTDKLPDIKMQFSRDVLPTDNNNDYFCIVQNGYLCFYISENFINNSIEQKMALGANYEVIHYESLWSIKIRGFGGSICPNIYGPSNEINQLQFICH